MRFEVMIPEVWLRRVEVEADSYEDAIQKAEEYMATNGGDGTDLEEYSHTMDQNLWDALEVEANDPRIGTD